MLLRPDFKEPPNVKIMINIGALMDIPTGFYLKGKHGESILNGGLGMITGITGIGNNFKSTVMWYMMMSAASRIASMHPTNLSALDTEINTHESRLIDFMNRFDAFRDKDVVGDGTLSLTDQTQHFGNEWYHIYKDYLKNKVKEEGKLTVATPFLTRDGKTLLKIIVPTFSAIDSLTEFLTEDVAKIQDENELGEAGGNTMHMRQGLAKTRLLAELPSILGRSSTYMVLTAHMGKDMAIQAGPYAAPPAKKLQHMKQGDKMKGVTDKFYFLPNNLWQVSNASPLLNDTTKGPEYPINPNDPQPGNADLNIVTVKLLRSKSGPSGATMDIVVSQSEGVLPSLTEFHYLKSQKRYGLDGNMQTYHLDLLPDVSLSRPTVRSKIDSNPQLRRALNITAELCQINTIWRNLDSNLYCTPKQLYEDLIKLGYDWNVLLNTRGWWTINNDDHPIPFLSTMDLMLMRVEKFRPKWLK